jgi:tetratricopeptide (TPR) repeat protein
MDGTGRLTEWIVACHCNLAEQQPRAPEIDFEICNACGKRLSQGRVGSFTQWIFRSDLCKCNVPAHMLPAITDELPAPTTSVVEPDEPELKIDGKPFPIDRYKPLLALGEGTAGRIFLCRDRMLGKKVAIKCLRTITPEQLIAFQHEAKATSVLHHPGIVPVIDFGATDNGAPYMVMEYVKGISLTECLNENGPLPVELAIPIFIRLAETLAHAHEKGIFHRDVQPSNILLVPVDGKEELEIRIIDFGIAAVDAALKRQHDTLAGTPAYMPPDQANGLKFDERSEVYALGCVMFSVLTGQPPFAGETALEVISMHAHNEPPALADVAAEKTFPPMLESIVARCLSKNPGDRFGNMASLREDLLEVQESLRSAARLAATPADGAVEKPRDWRKPAFVAAVLIFALLGIAFGGKFTTSLWTNSKAILNFDREVDSRKLSDQAWDELNKNNIGKAIELSDQAISLDRENLNALDIRGLAYFAMGEVDKAERDFADVIRRAKAVKFNSSAAEYHHAMIAQYKGDHSEFERYHKRSYARVYWPSKWELKTFAKWITPDGMMIARSFGDTPKSFDGIGSVTYDTPKSVQLSALATDREITNLAGNKVIRRIELMNSDISPAALKTIATMPNIDDVCFQNAGAYTDSELEFLSTVPKLEDLTVSSSALTGSFLKNFNGDLMRAINFQITSSVNREGLSNVSRMKHLNRLEISGAPKIKNSDIDLIRSLPLKSFSWVPRFKRVASFHIRKGDVRTVSRAEISYYGASDLGALMSNAALLEANLDCDGLTAEAAAEIAKSQGLRSIWLQGSRPLNSEALSKLVESKSIYNLFLVGPILDERAAEILSASRGFYSVGLIHVNMDRQALKALAKTKIKDLKVRGEHLTMEDLLVLGEFKSPRRMTVFDNYTGITRDDVALLKTMVPKCKLKFQQIDQSM